MGVSSLCLYVSDSIFVLILYFVINVIGVMIIIDIVITIILNTITIIVFFFIVCSDVPFLSFGFTYDIILFFIYHH